MVEFGLIEYSNNYPKTSGSLWKYYKERPAVNDGGNIIDFDGTNKTHSFKFKTKRTGNETGNYHQMRLVIMKLIFLIN